MINQKLVTIVIHFNNKCADTSHAIIGIRNQSYEQLQILCFAEQAKYSEVNEAIEKYGDKRFTLLECKNESNTVAFNMGLSSAEGEYIVFLNGEDECDNDLIKCTCERLEETKGDLVLFDYGVRKDEDKVTKIKPFRGKLDEVKNIVQVFNKSGYYCAVFRRSFLLDHRISITQVEDYSFCDIYFLPLCLLTANNCSCVEKQLLVVSEMQKTFTADEMSNYLAFRKTSAENALDYYEEWLQSGEKRTEFIYYLLWNSVEPYITELINYNDSIISVYYNWLKDIVLGLSESENKYCKRNDILYRFMGILQLYSDDEYIKHANRRIYISLTSFPARLKNARKAIDSLLRQTKKSDGILLWLAEEEYPNGYDDVPEDINELNKKHKITIKWCEKNLKPHKKYYYVFQEYPDDLIITVDDDLIYKNDMLTYLFISYLEHPRAVSAMRTHLMCFDEERKLLPYHLWIKNSNVCVKEESMQLMATTGAGTLFLPRLIDSALFNTEAIENCCINADDLWLKCIELISGIPVVQATQSRELVYVPETQSVGLWSRINKYENDNTLKQIIDWVDENIEHGLIYKQMTSTTIGKNMMLAENIYDGIIKDRAILLSKQAQLEKELKKEKLKQANKKQKQKIDEETSQKKSLKRRIKRYLKI